MGVLSERDRCGGEAVSEVELLGEKFGKSEGRRCSVSYRGTSSRLHARCGLRGWWASPNRTKLNGRANAKRGGGEGGCGGV